ncbi:hypothetical protein U9M48_034943 [Paspalum notatum var. saurae]|uniref:Uncharacterized protein n=1 Tax=Paspalum notatum var. saurae TaxID=547442 RepID=A0AAQ3UDQ1_PASNO
MPRPEDPSCLVHHGTRGCLPRGEQQPPRLPDNPASLAQDIVDRITERGRRSDPPVGRERTEEEEEEAAAQDLPQVVTD